MQVCHKVGGKPGGTQRMANSNDSLGTDRTFMRTSAGSDRSAPPFMAGVRLGPWAIEAPIASGGMGQVYRAMRADGVYNQAVAVKLIHDNDPVRVDRFGAERQRLAMELVEGRPIMPPRGRYVLRHVSRHIRTVFGTIEDGRRGSFLAVTS